MNTKKILIGAIGLSWLLISIPPAKASTVLATTANHDWQAAVSLGANPGSALLYGRLSARAAQYYSFTVTQPLTLHVNVEINPRVAGKFDPRIILYSPESITVGPALPMPQPPLTMAAVYPANASVKRVEGPLFTSLLKKVDQYLPIVQPGRYYLAVYNAGPISGAYRLSLVQDVSSASLGNIWQRWWLTGSWFGPQSGAIIIPLILVALAIAGWVTLHHENYKLPRPKTRRHYRTLHHGHVS